MHVWRIIIRVELTETSFTPDKAFDHAEPVNCFFLCTIINVPDEH
jgi:hypothetical protein